MNCFTGLYTVSESYFRAGTLYGVAKLASIHSYRVLDCSGSGTLGDLASALVAVDNAFVAPAVINLSLAYLFPDSTINSIIATLISDGVTLVAAAGNEGINGCDQPSAVTGVIAVGATTAVDAKASYSNFGSCIDVFAPGDQLLSDWLSGGTAILSGTSMATGVVTGAVALLFQTAPSATPSQVVNGIIDDATVGVLSSIGSGSPNWLLYVVGLNTPAPGATSPPATSSTGSVLSCSSIALFLLLVL